MSHIRLIQTWDSQFYDKKMQKTTTHNGSWWRFLIILECSGESLTITFGLVCLFPRVILLVDSFGSAFNKERLRRALAWNCKCIKHIKFVALKCMMGFDHIVTQLTRWDYQEFWPWIQVIGINYAIGRAAYVSNSTSTRRALKKFHKKIHVSFTKCCNINCNYHKCLKLGWNVNNSGGDTAGSLTVSISL